MSRFIRIPIPNGGPVEEIDGRQDATYYPMTTGEGVVAALIATRIGEFPRPRVMVIHFNEPLAIKIDRLVELHLKQFRSALLEAIKGETSECEFHVLRPTLELRLQLPDGDSCKCSSHLARVTKAESEASTDKGDK